MFGLDQSTVLLSTLTREIFSDLMPYVNPMRSRRVGVLGSAAIRSYKIKFEPREQKQPATLKQK